MSAIARADGDIPLWSASHILLSTQVPRFVAVYTMTPEALAALRKRPKSDQETIDPDGAGTMVADWHQIQSLLTFDRIHSFGRF